MLRSFVENKHCCFFQKFDTWQDAIRAACAPLIVDGTCDPEYAEEIVKCVETYGPYIIVAPHVAMPHSSLGGNGVHKTTISFMKVEEPVVFDENDRSKDAHLFFTLAAVNSDEHLKNMVLLSNLLMNEGLLDALMEVKNEKDLLQVAEKMKE